ncbi:MAG: hypothetical protein E7231_13535 [Cellulosilyticum sp.]|nr:hypothetical protein [Cellulosilyticum sp.]
MNKKVSIPTLLIHLFWALSWSIGIYYVEYGIMSLCIMMGVENIVSANVVGGAVLFLVFYLIENKLIEEEITKRGLFLISTYIIPILYQGIMIFTLSNSIQEEQQMASLMFILTFTLLIMGLFFRGMLEFVNYYRKHIKVKKRGL